MLDKVNYICILQTCNSRELHDAFIQLVNAVTIAIIMARNNLRQSIILTLTMF